MTKPEPDVRQDAAGQWLVLVRFFQRGLHALPPSDWFSDIPGSADFNTKAEALQRLDVRHMMVLDSAVQQWCSQECWPENLTEQPLYCLKQRVFVALFYSRGNVIESYDGAATIVPFPNRSPQEVALWYLTTWWERRGLFLLAEGET